MCLALGALMSACGADAPATATKQPPTPVLTLYLTPTASRTAPATPAARDTPTPAITPTPSPTPFAHVIVKGDTMGSIALKYGVDLQDLLAANPEVDPHFMTVGKTVVIPLRPPDATEEALPSATPVPVSWGNPHCYLTLDHGAWCFLQVENKTSVAVENLSTWISLYTPAGGLLASQVALPPLNLLPSGAAMPLAAYFAPPVPDTFDVKTGASTVLPVARGKSRYLEARPEGIETRIDEGGDRAVVQGKIHLAGKGGAAGVLWLAVIAYAEDGRVAGIRKWEAIKPPREVPFEIAVFSLGPPIARVELLTEARPGAGE